MPPFAGSPLRRAAVLLVMAVALLVPSTPFAATCGNGLVEAGEQCDAGSLLATAECSRSCTLRAFEPGGLPFEPRGQAVPTASTPVPASAVAAPGPVDPPAIHSPRLTCAPFDVRDGARLGKAARVRYRLHVCTDKKGTNVFTDQQVRAAMATTATQFAAAGIQLEEESLVHFREDDCAVAMDSAAWEDALVANTPEGVLAVAFVADIFTTGTQFPVGGYCWFEGPICVNSALASTLVVHEMGHFFGLAHTFECAYGKETAATCAEDGDFLCDTPPDRGPLGLQGIGYCDDKTVLNGSCSGACGAKRCTDGSRPDGYNWMSYFDCLPGRFSAEQQDFMRCMLDHEMRGYNADWVATTTTTTTTSTTAAPPMCGDLNDDGRLTASDALGSLKAGVGVSTCPMWICDWNGSGSITASDALAVLKAAVGVPTQPHCPTPS